MPHYPQKNNSARPNALYESVKRSVPKSAFEAWNDTTRITKSGDRLTAPITGGIEHDSATNEHA